LLPKFLLFEGKKEVALECILSVEVIPDFYRPLDGEFFVSYGKKAQGNFDRSLG
jgi:hypothetical protein